jgi:hypothetical protein
MIATEISPRDLFYSLIDKPKLVYVQDMGDLRGTYDINQDLISISVKEEDFENFWSTVYHEYFHKLFFHYQLQHNYLLDDADEEPFGEIVCEMGAAYICEQTGIYDKTMDHHIKYITGWLSVLRNPFLLMEIVTVVLAMVENLFQKNLCWMDLPPEVFALVYEKMDG